MRSFGRCGGGGRRAANRVQGPVLAVLTTLQQAKSAVLVDLSCTGARVSGDDLPPKGTDLFIRIGPADVFATVAWRRGDMAGIAFDQPITAFEVDQVRRRAAEIKMMQLSPDEKLALDQWMVGNVG